MSENKFLHLYLTDAPEDTEIQTILEFYGFELERSYPREKGEPNEYHWRWRHEPLSSDGLRLVYFDAVFSDDLYHGKYGTFIVLEGTKASSPVDFAFLDVATKFLLDRYGGTIRNPNNPDNPTYLCGKARQAVAA
jgi:hypothetical protein